jgi:DNA polymerase-3 subunit beta
MRAERRELSTLLTAITKVVDTKNTIPLLSHVLVEVEDGELFLRATDLDIEASGSMSVDSDTSYAFAVPGRDFADIIKRIPADTVDMELDGAWLHIRAGRSRYKLPTLAADSFPQLDMPTDGVEFTADLAGLTKQVGWAVGGGQSGYNLSGVYLHSDGALVAVATDAKRLTRADGPAAPAFAGVILPTKLLANLPTGQVDVLVGTDRLAVQQGAVVMIGKLLEGTYPNYERFWPRDQEYTLRAKRAELRAAVERVAALSDEDTGKGVVVSIAPGGLTLSVLSRTRGLAEEEVPVEYSGEPYEVGFNVAFLAEMLGAVPGETVEVAIGGKTGANFVGTPGFAGCLMYFNLGR